MDLEGILAKWSDGVWLKAENKNNNKGHNEKKLLVS